MGVLGGMWGLGAFLATGACPGLCWSGYRLCSDRGLHQDAIRSRLPKARDALIRRSGFGGWPRYLCVAVLMIGVGILGYATFHRGLVSMLADPSPFFS